MPDLAIRMEGISKQYRIGEFRPRYETLRDHIATATRRMFSGGESATQPTRTIWALRDVSFEIEHGEIVGLIGRNGAGKTTLLRLLSRITRPTEGVAELHGRVGSLLEVGTGFHPELTGRENIFLNGAILGMTRREIVRKFPEIVEFAGVEKFIDTPVKRYSSGMHVRLAFSVAAHLEPEILLVDEVLAVGDAEFQKRCLGKMEAIGRSGRTIVFVSHTMPTILRLCERAVLLEHGHVVADGPAHAVVAKYLHSEHGTTAYRDWPDAEQAPGGELARMRSVRVVNEHLATVETADVRGRVGIELTIDVLHDRGPAFVPWLTLFNAQGMHVFSVMDTDPSWRKPLRSGRYVSIAWIPGNLLNEGTIIVSPSLNTFAPGGKAIRQAHVEEAVAFQVSDPGEGDSARGYFAGEWPGPVRPLLEWTQEYQGPVLEPVTAG